MSPQDSEAELVKTLRTQLAEAERQRDEALGHVVAVALGIEHSTACTPETPCVRCERDARDVEIKSLREWKEAALGALGEHPDSELDIAQRISDIRDEGRAHFHRASALAEERDRLRAALQRIAESEHEKACKYQYYPFRECPQCEQAEEIARKALADKHGETR